MDINTIQAEAIRALATLISALITIGLYQLQRYIKNKYQIELNEAARNELDSIISEAVAYAEERAHQNAKSGLAMAGDVKMALAKEFALARKAAQKAGPEVIEKLILSYLGYSRSNQGRVIL